MTVIVMSLYFGVVIMGAIIVVVTAFLVIKSTLKNDITRIEKQPIEHIETTAVIKKRHVSICRFLLRSNAGNLVQPLKFLLRPVLGVINLPSHSASSDQEIPNWKPANNEQILMPLPDIDNPELETNMVPPSPEHEVPSGQSVSGEPEVNMIDTSPEKLDQEIPNVEPANDEKPEHVEHDNSEELNEASDDEKGEQPTTEDAVFDLFKGEIGEESKISKFAATLNDVDIHDLLNEAQSLINHLRGSRG